LRFQKQLRSFPDEQSLYFSVGCTLKLFRLTNIINYQKQSLPLQQLTLEMFARSSPQKQVFRATAAQ